MNVSRGMAAAIIVIGIAIVGWFGWQTLAPKSAPRPVNLDELRLKHDPGLQAGRSGGSSPAPPGIAPPGGPGRMPTGRPMMRPGMGPGMAGNGPMPGR